MKESNRHTVYHRYIIDDETFVSQSTFEGEVVARGEDSADGVDHYTVVYDMFDGNYLLEHSSQTLPAEPVPDGYEIVPQTKLRSAVLQCFGLIPFQISDQLNLGITEADFPPPPPIEPITEPEEE